LDPKIWLLLSVHVGKAILLKTGTMMQSRGSSRSRGYQRPNHQSRTEHHQSQRAGDAGERARLSKRA
jgi:hypothetical protein